MAALAVLAGAGLSTAAAGATSTPVELSELTLVGHGDGPGIGMGQWGAFGYAVRYHFSYQRILAHYYGGTRTTTLAALGQPSEPTVKVVILENVNLKTNVGYDPVVTSPSAFTISSQPGPAGPAPAGRSPGGSGASAPGTSVSGQPTGADTGAGGGTPGASGTTGTSGGAGSSGTTGTSGTSGASHEPASVTVPAGMAVDLRLESDGTWSAFEGASCAAASAAASKGTSALATGLIDPIARPASAAMSAPAPKLLTLCRHDKVDEPLRGAIEAYDRQGYERTLNLVPLDAYLDGVVPAEVSASWGADGSSAGAPQGRPWGFQALEAQAVAARSYALATVASGGWLGYAGICDSTYCQAYVGADYEQPASDAAVAATAGQVQVAGPGAGTVVLARYAASSGGWTAPSSFPAVADLGDACVVPGDPLECNPVHSWQATISGTQLSRAFPELGGVVSVRVVRRDHHGALGGRALDVALTGRRRRAVLSASTFAGDLGLYSDWFAVATTGPTSTSASGPSGSGAPPTTSTTAVPASPVPTSPGAAPVPSTVPTPATAPVAVSTGPGSS